VPQFEPGHRPPATSPPPPPCGQSCHEPEPTAVFRVRASRAQLRHPRTAAIGDLNPDSAGAGRHRDRDRLPGKTRATMLQAVREKLAREQDSFILAGMPRAEDRADERADNPNPLHQPGNLHALAHRRPSHQRTAFLPAREDPQGPNGRAGKCTLTSAATVKPNTHRWRAARRKTAGYACLSRVLPAKTGPAGHEAESGAGNPPGGAFRIAKKCLTVSFHFIMRITYDATSNAGYRNGNGNGEWNGPEGECTPRR
jgi:hypothetical protein